jgi:glyoxylase-like metal-dependent hydrolase (beta-lactamase superfamily II)
MHIKKILVGPLGVNCVLIFDEVSRQAVVVDPGDQSKKIIHEIQKEKLTLTHILLTHGHFDHVGAVGALKKVCGGIVCLHEKDIFLYKKADEYAESFGLRLESQPPTIDHYLTEGSEIFCGNVSLKVLHTPGHSPGSVCLVVGSLSDLPDMSDESDTWHGTVLLTGDTLFAGGGVGRTDLPGGSEKDLLKSLNKIKQLYSNCRIIPGHGPEIKRH